VAPGLQYLSHGQVVSKTNTKTTKVLSIVIQENLYKRYIYIGQVTFID